MQKNSDSEKPKDKKKTKADMGCQFKCVKKKFITCSYEVTNSIERITIMGLQ